MIEDTGEHYIDNANSENEHYYDDEDGYYDSEDGSAIYTL